MAFHEGQQEHGPEKKELTAEAGVAKAALEIERLLKSQDLVVVAVTGSSTDVGKSFVSGELQKVLMRKGVSFACASSISNLKDRIHFPERPTPGKVIILTAEYYPYCGIASQDSELSEASDITGLPFSKIDLRIFVYRSDKPFYEENNMELADIVIRNDGAVDKKGR